LWLDAGGDIRLEGRVCASQARAGHWSDCCGNAMNRSRLHIFYSGRVQGVGFRYTVKSLVSGFEVTGTIRNLPDGRVELVAEGTREELDGFRRAIQDCEVGRFIRHEDVSWSEAVGRFRGFEIVS
jgi:acylphosphatase